LLDEKPVRAGSPNRRPALAPRPAAPPANPSSASSSGDARSQPAAVQRLEFDPDQVEGTLQRPGDARVDGDPAHARFRTLIEIPASFEPSMTKMIEDL